MKRSAIFVALMWLLVGCSAPPDSSSAIAKSDTSTDPLAASFASAPKASEWLMNSKHTLRGLSPDHTVNLLQDLSQFGAVESRVADIHADAADPSFKSAGALLVEMPSSAARRKSLLDWVKQNQSVAVDDNEQKYIAVEISALPNNTPTPSY